MLSKRAQEIAEIVIWALGTLFAVLLVLGDLLADLGRRQTLRHGYAIASSPRSQVHRAGARIARSG